MSSIEAAHRRSDKVDRLIQAVDLVLIVAAAAVLAVPTFGLVAAIALQLVSGPIGGG